MFNDAAGQAYQQRIQQDREAREAAEAAAQAQRTSHDADALGQVVQQQGIDALREGEAEIVRRYGQQMAEELRTERAKSDLQIEEESLERQAEALGWQLAELYKNATQNSPAIETIEAQLREKTARLKAIEASKPKEPSNAYLLNHSATAASARRNG